jgi:hypothetical protein
VTTQGITIDENYIQNRASIPSTGSSARTSTSISEQDSGFELIQSKDPQQTDKEMIQDIIAKLLKSTPITIEEKGQVI